MRWGPSYLCLFLPKEAFHKPQITRIKKECGFTESEMSNSLVLFPRYSASLSDYQRALRSPGTLGGQPRPSSR